MKEKLSVEMERVYNAPVADVWHAITDREAMRQWYFDTAGFRPEVGAEFSFSAGKEGNKCLHLCQVKEIVPGKKISYSWRYEGEEGNSLLTWELFDEGAKTRLKLTHTGLETFTIHKKEDFVAGWTYFLDNALPKFVEVKS